MAKITIAGDSVVITASVPLSTIETLKKYRPKALCLYDTDDAGKKVEVFRVGTGKAGVINEFSATFASETHNETPLACITEMIPAGVENVADWAADKYGPALTMLNKLEAGFAATMEAVAAEKEAVQNLITVV